MYNTRPTRPTNYLVFGTHYLVFRVKMGVKDQKSVTVGYFYAVGAC